MKREKLIIYPYDSYACPVVRHSRLANYDVVGVAAPAGWGLTDKDAGVVDGGANLGIRISSDFSDLLETCDTVLFTNSIRELGFAEYIYPKLMQTMEAKKNIIYSIDLPEDVYHKLKAAAEKAGIYFKYDQRCLDYAQIPPRQKKLHEINTPTIFVLGTTERTHKFEIQLVLREQLIKMGYRVSQIGSRNLGVIFGFNSFPDFMNNRLFTDADAILMFNDFVKRIEHEEQPDVIIIGVPGGVMPINNTHTNYFGLMAYKIAHALTPDAVVFSSTYEDYGADYFGKMATSIKYKIGCEITAHVLANVNIDWNASRFNSELVYVTLSSDYVDKKIANYRQQGISVYNILNLSDAESLANMIVDKLSDYSEIEAI